jgi:ribosomal protein S18 acetylase RimI-like enzyme
MIQRLKGLAANGCGILFFSDYSHVRTRGYVQLSLSDIDCARCDRAGGFPQPTGSPAVRFRTLIDRPTAETLVFEAGGGVCGYAMILFRAGAALARLYSLAVAPAEAGKGYGRALLSAAETAAMEHDRILLRLEVREDNEAAITGFTKNAGYRRIGRYRGLLC